MNQSDKKNLEFIMNSGISYFLQDSPRIWFENSKSSENLNEIIEDNKKILEIKKVIESIKNHETSLKKSANNLVVYDGTLDAKVMFIGEAPGQEEDKLGTPFVGKAGQLLNKMLAAAGVMPGNCLASSILFGLFFDKISLISLDSPSHLLKSMFL